jgi:hypothetical protein
MWMFAVLLSLAMAMPARVLAETTPAIGYGRSPSDAIRRVFHIEQILRINIVEPYAIVSARGQGPLFGDGPSTEFLLEHFDFGWQVLGIPDDLCPSERGIDPAAARSLMVGMPKSSTQRSSACDELDSGPSRSVAQVRKLMYGPVVPYVRVADNYAFSQDYGDGGGCGLFHFEADANRWKLLSSCKGMMDAGVIDLYHIPQKTVCVLRPAIPDLKCPGKP